VQKLVWRVKLVADFGAGPATQIEVARIEREDWAGPETLGLTLVEGKQLTAAIQTEMVRAQASTMGERFRCCAHCGAMLASKGYRQMTFRSLFGHVPLRVRRLVRCQCRDVSDESSFRERSKHNIIFDFCTMPKGRFGVGSRDSNRDITAKHRLRPLWRHLSVRRASRAAKSRHFSNISLLKWVLHFPTQANNDKLRYVVMCLQ
jgi:hypothetical protein